MGGSGRLAWFIDLKALEGADMFWLRITHQVEWALTRRPFMWQRGPLLVVTGTRFGQRRQPDAAWPLLSAGGFWARHAAVLPGAVNSSVRRGAVAARRAHNPKVVGSNPTAATARIAQLAHQLCGPGEGSITCSLLERFTLARSGALPVGHIRIAHGAV